MCRVTYKKPPDYRRWIYCWDCCKYWMCPDIYEPYPMMECGHSAEKFGRSEKEIAMLNIDQFEKLLMDGGDPTAPVLVES